MLDSDIGASGTVVDALGAEDVVDVDDCCGGAGSVNWRLMGCNGPRLVLFATA